MRKTLLAICTLCFSTLLFGQAPVMTERTIYQAEVYFDFGKDTIRADADSVLNELIVFCEKQVPFYLKITAHTDAVGSDRNNQQLSERRAASVMSFLRERGIPSDSTTIGMFGEKRPVAENNTDQGRQKNRRATIEVIKVKKMVPLEGDILDKETGKGIVADVVIRTRETRDSLQTDEKGHYESLVPLGEVIGVDVWARGTFWKLK